MLEDTITPLFSTQWGRRAGWAALVVMSLIVVITLIKMSLSWHADVALTRGQVDTSSNTSVYSDQSAELIAQIPGWHLFGNVTAVEQTASLPITSLQLRLIGVVHVIPENLSRVIISEAGQAGKVYQTGDNLPAGVRVNAITQDGVILENSGRLEKLPLQRQQLSFQGMPKKLLREE